MSIGFIFTMHWDCKELFAVLEELSAEADAQFAMRGEDTAGVELCRAGTILFQCRGGSVHGNCQTNAAGPGFHAAAVDFLDALAERLETAVEVEDDTGYHDDRNFERMKEEHFYAWLDGLTDHLAGLAEGDCSDICICWDLDRYQPEKVGNTVVTPTGRHSLQRWIEAGRDNGPRALAEDFFIWNERAKDARFYRNTALAMLWEDCCFVPSERSERDAGINDRIVDLLETAMDLDQTLPFPLDEYRQLCGLSGRAPRDVDALLPYRSEYPIGYRRGIVSYAIGNVSLPVPGHYLINTDDGIAFFDRARENWHAIRVSAFSTKGTQREFTEKLFCGLPEAPIEFALHDGKCRMGYAGSVVEDESGEYQQIVAEVLTERQVTLITVSFASVAEKEAMFDLLQGLQLLRTA